MAAFNCTNNNQTVVQQLNELFGNKLNLEMMETMSKSSEFNVKRSPNRLPGSSDTDASIYPIFHTDATVSLKKSRKAVEIERVISEINAGYKVLVLLRGLPGSGKSTLAKSILQNTIGCTDENIKKHILSTDDFFMKNGVYDYDSSQLGEAHGWNHQRSFNVMSKGFSPVIIDNTNTQMWEMKPYAMMATDFGYFLEILEPDTHWCFNDKELTKRNKHGVAKSTIKNMLERYQKNVTPMKLLTAYDCKYKLQNPPQFRLYPPLRSITGAVANPQNNSKSESSFSPKFMDFHELHNQQRPQLSTPQRPAPSSSVDDILMNGDASFLKTPVLKPVHAAKIKPSTSFFDNINISSWGVDEVALRSWDIVTPLKTNETVSEAIIITDDEDEDVNIDKTTAATNTDDNDFYFVRNVLILPPPQGLKVVDTCSRDINRNSSPRLQTIRKKIMIDKSCLTEDYLDDHIAHIDNLVRVFPNVSRSVIKYWYEKCHCDFDCTIELLLAEKEEVINVIVEEQAHAISEQVVDFTVDSDSGSSSSENVTPITKSKRKNNSSSSDESHVLKKHIESKINISNDYYSDKLLRIKQQKYAGEMSTSAMITDGTLEVSRPEAEVPSSFSDVDMAIDDFEWIDSPSSPTNKASSDSEEIETVEFNLGDHFVKQLEDQFGDPNLLYPKGFQPVVQLPVTLARQLYTFYIESVYQQMDAQKSIMDTLIHEDEEFARKLQDEQEQAAILPKPIPSTNPTDIPDIMKEQRELSKWQAEADKWKNDTPDTLAARLTRQKLFDSFPSLDKNTLVEILHAHDNVYKDTIDTLLASTSILNVRGNIETIREPPVDKTMVEEMWEAHESCNQVKIKDDEVSTATNYRDTANVFLEKRTRLYEKAQIYYQRGMREVAHFYSTLAAKQTRLYEQANSLAATAFLDEHSKRLEDFNTLDLHFLYVKEAIPHLDIFLDRNINLLRLSSSRNSECLQIITGRGRNSKNGVAKIRPAVIDRLKERKIGYQLLNPGLLRIKVTKLSKVSSEL